MSWLPKAPKARQRLMIFLVVAPLLVAAVGLSLYAMRDQVVYFYTPEQAISAHAPKGRPVRLGGLVETGSVVKLPDGSVRFVITDGKAKAEVRYHGDLPDLFREGQGIVAQGAFDDDSQHVFVAKEVLAKHDETYMPKEVSDALKKRGEWRDGKTDPKSQTGANP